jgi:hypothetical protein
MTGPKLIGVIPKDSSGVRRALKSLAAAKSRQIVERSGRWYITDVGVARIEERINKELASR